MRAYIFRVTSEHNEEVYREILVPENHTFEDFHFALLDAFRIESGEMASFYLSDGDWNKKEEITLMDMGQNDTGMEIFLMGEVGLGDKVSASQTYFYYTYDFLFCKNFQIELIGQEKGDYSEPTVLKSEGRYQEDVSAYDDFYLDDLEIDEDDSKPKKSRKSSDDVDDFDDFNDFDNDSEVDDFDNDFDDDYNNKKSNNSFDDYDY